MRISHPTRDELLDTFHHMLASVLAGGGIHSCSGLDMETENALWDVAKAHPDVSDQLIAQALRAFADQLDGSTAARRKAALEQRFAEHLAERQRQDPR
ncbi:hypothetical protein [Streptomyces sp. PTY087I2]|uniref:hypothetical protein n=1 Tax=Streptomyces sp. PTY087I2 TaxID=1819298 RepID=UPI00080B8097|nr:hypothetical protein [Streptomyces sp. PTY087I2]OCC08120.1 hypothetical protein A3Q37_06080 [Streptomyces sp. PTY087I2]